MEDRSAEIALNAPVFQSEILLEDGLAAWLKDLIQVRGITSTL